MDTALVSLMGEMLKAAALGGASVAGSSAVSALFEQFTLRRRSHTAQLRFLLSALGSTTPRAIRKLVAETFRDAKPSLDPRVREDLIALLLCLSRRAHQINTVSQLGTIYRQTEPFLDRMLSSKFLPKRRTGERVTANHAWQLRGFLGIGSFGEVWAAGNIHTRGLPPRAYKFFTAPSARVWLERERDALEAVREHLCDHPNIVRLEDVDLPPLGDPYLAFEYIDGGSLEDWLTDAQRPKLSKPDMIRGVVAAVAAAHGRDIAHRDLKPSNILLTRSANPVPMITDFGVAQVTPTELAADELVVGTPMYLPPEAQQPNTVGTARQADVFALGVIWYQLLVERLERPPYDFAEELREGGADSRTVRLIERCLAKPSRRFADAGELAEQLGQADLPMWESPPEGLLDVSGLVREFLAAG